VLTGRRKHEIERKSEGKGEGIRERGEEKERGRQRKSFDSNKFSESQLHRKHTATKGETNRRRE
jgi:hypothetical protein